MRSTSCDVFINVKPTLLKLGMQIKLKEKSESISAQFFKFGGIMAQPKHNRIKLFKPIKEGQEVTFIKCYSVVC